MKIVFSRHANRRAQLYCIDKSAIIKILESQTLSYGRNDILVSIDGLAFQVKIVALVENDIITVLTNYPLKRGRS